MVKSEIQNVKLRFGIIGNCEGLNRAIDVAMQVAPTDLSVLVTGESGVGKESFPQIIHQFSRRKHGPYIAVNCGAIPEGTIDSELFGHEKGAFTGAISDRNGYFAEANGGTIFLDEVGELPLSTQARLLRVLETGEYIKVGSSKVQKTDVRIVAATNVDFSEAIADGRFREDLYYRLNTVPIKVPALRERPDDIPLLFRKFAADFAEKYRMPAIQLTDDARRLLVSYTWPGNIRQLKNITEQISIIETNRDITADILQGYLPAQPVSKYPTLLGGLKPEGEKGFQSEREILYQVLFDMRRDVTELKKLVHDIMAERAGGAPMTPASTTPVHYIPETPVSLMQTPSVVLNPVTEVGKVSNVTSVGNVSPVTSGVKVTSADVSDVQDTEEYVEENLSLDEVEKEMIRKALERHHGKRKNAANDLKISERTLYRKIKEYGLE
ncbi:MAG TPA: sigma 54-interacting transcriptional regulator [Bacteroides mediterraneensis]|uniref:sigma 54-interacting transcriptional regulator n=1 Tax=Bacteroides mediterraneensis TaxID=1841856 RepID=UPI002612DEBA|nr:sigma 54-interacting transcriptional regulator [Bacteroides mediterraneensis]HJH65161.1 sigma 54-interacting transcriptional regulator [Bacteroides mediterraneensis]